MKPKARLIVTLECQRQCWYCANKQPGILEQATPIDSPALLADYQEVMITGGEPLLQIDRTIQIMRDIRKANPLGTIYLFTAFYVQNYFAKLEPLIDGLQFTLHDNSDASDVDMFEKLQRNMMGTRKSCRFRPGPNVNVTVPLIPTRWSGIKSTRWLLGTECKVADDEQLFILKG